MTVAFTRDSQHALVAETGPGMIAEVDLASVQVLGSGPIDVKGAI